MPKQTRSIKIYPHYQSNKQVPQLRLSGQWLEELGFKVGDQVSVTMREELLVIEPIQEVAEKEQDYRAELKAVKKTLKQLVK